MFTTANPLRAKASKIVAGQEPEKTNELLQVLAIAILKKVNNAQTLITQYLLCFASMCAFVYIFICDQGLCFLATVRIHDGKYHSTVCMLYCNSIACTLPIAGL